MTVLDFARCVVVTHVGLGGSVHVVVAQLVLSKDSMILPKVSYLR